MPKTIFCLPPEGHFFGHSFFHNFYCFSVKNKTVGKWENNGPCIGIGEDRTCGKGIQIQSRTCEDGTFDKCQRLDNVRNITCKDAGTALKPCPTTILPPGISNRLKRN